MAVRTYVCTGTSCRNLIGKSDSLNLHARVFVPYTWSIYLAYQATGDKQYFIETITTIALFCPDDIVHVYWCGWHSPQVVAPTLDELFYLCSYLWIKLVMYSMHAFWLYRSRGAYAGCKNRGRPRLRFCVLLEHVSNGRRTWTPHGTLSLTHKRCPQAPMWKYPASPFYHFL